MRSLWSSTALQTLECYNSDSQINSDHFPQPLNIEGSKWNSKSSPDWAHVSLIQILSHGGLLWLIMRLNSWRADFLALVCSLGLGGNCNVQMNCETNWVKIWIFWSTFRASRDLEDSCTILGHPITYGNRALLNSLLEILQVYSVAAA